MFNRCPNAPSPSATTHLTCHFKHVNHKCAHALRQRRPTIRKQSALPYVQRIVIHHPFGIHILYCFKHPPTHARLQPCLRRVPFVSASCKMPFQRGRLCISSSVITYHHTLQASTTTLQLRVNYSLAAFTNRTHINRAMRPHNPLVLYNRTERTCRPRPTTATANRLQACTLSRTNNTTTSHNSYLFADAPHS